MRRNISIFILGLVLRVALIASNPIIFGGDSIIRLVNRDNLLMGHQLPMLQIFISAISKISTDPVVVRYMMAVIGAIAGVAFYWLAQDLVGEKWAFPAALLFVTNPYLLVLSTVPYQEILMLAGLLLAFHFFYTDKWMAASVCLAFACLTRHEAWVACPILALAYFLGKDRSAKGAFKASVLFGWAPVVWLVSRGLSPPGHFILEPSISVWRLQRYVFLGWISVRDTQIPVVLLAVAGAWRVYKDRSRMDQRLLIQIAFVAVFCIGVLFAAQGTLPDPERYVSAREAHIPVYSLLLLAALGLPQWPRWALAIVSLSVVLGVVGAWWYQHRETSKPELQLSCALAQYLDSAVHEGEHALVLAKPADLRLYFQKALETGGPEGLRQAQLNPDRVDWSPPDYQRVLVHSHLGRDRLLAVPVGCAEWVAVWSDFPEAARELAGAEPVKVLRSGPMSVTILRRPCGV